MTILVSGIFALALALSFVVIGGTLRASSAQISAALAGRHGAVKGSRIVHIGAVRHSRLSAAAPAIILPFKPRFEAMAPIAIISATPPSAPMVSPDTLPLAA